MALLSIREIADIAIMTAALGFIFSGMFQSYSRKHDYDPLTHYRSGFDWEAFRFAAYVTAPAIILHEFGHKFVAMAFGVSAVFHAAYTWLAIGVAMKLLSFPFIFFVRAFVTHASVGALADSLIAFSGPAVNLVLWLGAWLIHRQGLMDKRYGNGLLLTAKINMLLFIFNMLPIPGFDGFRFFLGLVGAFL